jgi:hypothetical protein
MTIIDTAARWEYDLWQASADAPLPATAAPWGSPGPGAPRSTATGGFPRRAAGAMPQRRTSEVSRAGSCRGTGARGDRPRLGNRDRLRQRPFRLSRAGIGATLPGRRLPDAGAPPTGSLLQLDMSPSEINALEIPGWKKTVLRAMVTYGMYFATPAARAIHHRDRVGQPVSEHGLPDRWWSFAALNDWEPFDPAGLLRIQRRGSGRQTLRRSERPGRWLRSQHRLGAGRMVAPARTRPVRAPRRL